MIFIAGVGFRVYSYYNLNKDRKTVAFEEHIEMDNGTFTYEKLIG